MFQIKLLIETKPIVCLPWEIFTLYDLKRKTWTTTGIRTSILRISSPALYHLSYPGSHAGSSSCSNLPLETDATFTRRCCHDIMSLFSINNLIMFCPMLSLERAPILFWPQVRGVSPIVPMLHFSYIFFLPLHYLDLHHKTLETVAIERKRKREEEEEWTRERERYAPSFT